MQVDSTPRGLMTPTPDSASLNSPGLYSRNGYNYDPNSSSADHGPGPATFDDYPPVSRFMPTPPRSRTRTLQRAVTVQEEDVERTGCLNRQDTIALFQRKLEEARKDTQHVLSGTDQVAEAIKPTLTIDLGREAINRLPHEVIELIMADVERLSLSHNNLAFLPAQMADCKQLRYLNVRQNEMKEIPPCIFSMPFLEILDVSKNKISAIPSTIRNLESLRVFSIVSNKLRDLPSELADLPRLKVLKVSQNPFRKSIEKIIRSKEQEVAYSAMTENERDAALTLQILKYLRSSRPATVATPILDAGEIPEPQSAVDQPRMQRRALSGRFPVIPANVSFENLVEYGANGENGQTKPSLPTKSHLRGLSGQSMSGIMKRPGVAPLISGNERNRSNSESVVPASAQRQQRRMGMLKRDRTQLDSIDETNVTKQNHFRGVSHNSILLRRNGSISLSSPGAGSSSPSSPRDVRKDRAQQFVRRLSSLPEHKSQHMRRPLIEGAKGILYALFQVTPHIDGLIGPSKGADPRRSQLEMAFYAASQNVDKLNSSLDRVKMIDPEDENAMNRQEQIIERDCAVCIKTFIHVTTQMQESTRKIVMGADPRYVRSLMLLLYGSIIEVRNAIKSFGVEVKHHRRQMSSGTTHPIATILEEPAAEASPSPNTQREIDNMTVKQSNRLRSDTVLKRPSPQSSVSLQPVQAVQPVSQVSNMNLTITTNHGPYSKSNSAMGQTSRRQFASRSRSNSRSQNYVSDSAMSTGTHTPQSTDGLSLPQMPGAPKLMLDTGLTDAQEEQRFEQIFLALTKAYETALQAVPITVQALTRCLDMAAEQRQPKNVIDVWMGLVQKSRQCLELSQALQIRLTNMKVKDSGVGLSSTEGGRHDPSFWVLCKTFLSSFVDLLTEMKEVRKTRLLILPQEAVSVLRPVQKACQEAGHAIATSPWNHLLQGIQPVPAPTPSLGPTPEQQRPVFNRSATVANSNVASYSTAIQQGIQSGHYPPNSRLQLQPSNIPTASTLTFTPTSMSASPLGMPLPATPLSAALGAAAQATVPSTPASLYSDSFFRGDVFQRAESLMNMPQASASVNFLSRR